MTLAPATAPRDRRGRLRLLGVLGVLGAFGPLSMDAYLPALPHVIASLHTRSSIVGLSLSASLIGLAFGQLLFGSLSDRCGRRPVVLAGVGSFVACSVLCALAPDIWLLVVFRLGQGAAGGAGIVVSRAVVRDLYCGDELGRIFSRLLLVSGSAPVLAPLLGAQVLRVVGWRGVFWTLAVVGGLVLAATAVFVPETLPAQRRSRHRVRETLAVYGRVLGDPRALPYISTATLFSGVLFGFISGSPFVVQKVYGRSPTVFSVVFAGLSAAMIILGQVNARLSRRHPIERLTAAGMSISATGSLGILVTSLVGVRLGIWPLLAALLLAVSPNGVVYPNCSALAMRDHAAHAGAAAGLIGVSTFLVGALISPLTGIAGERTAVPMGLVTAVCAGAGLVVVVAYGGAQAARPHPAVADGP